MDRFEREAQLKEMFLWAKNYRANNYDDMAIEHYKQYLAYRDRVDSGHIQNDDGSTTRSNLFIPRTYEQLDAWRARLVKSFFSSRPYVEFIPMPNTNADPEVIRQNEMKAKVAAANLDMQLEKNKIVKKYYDFITSVGIFPVGILGVGWRYETRKVLKRVPATGIYNQIKSLFGNKEILLNKEVEEVVWDDNEIVNIDYFDLWPDPRGRNSDVDTWRFAFQRELMTVEQLQQKLQWLKQSELGEVYDLEWDTLARHSANYEDGRDERQAQIGLTIERDDESYNEGDKGKRLINCIHYWTGEEYGILVNEENLAYYGKTPYQRHKKIPFIVQSFEPLPNEVYGRSLCYWLYNLQEELNTIRNQRIDNVSLVLNRVMITQGDVDDDLIMKPGARWREDFRDQIRWLDTPDVTGSSYREEEILKFDMENTVGTPAIARGVSSGNQTATEVVTQNGNAAIRFDVKIQLYEDNVKELFKMMDLNSQQFTTRDKMIYLYGEEAANAWQMISPYDIQGEWDYRPTGSNIDPAANKEVRRQQLLQAIQTVVQLQLPGDVYELTKDLFSTFDFRNPQKYLPPKEQFEQQKQQSMMAQQEQMNMQHQMEMEKIQEQAAAKENEQVIRGLAGVIQASMKGGGMFDGINTAGQDSPVGNEE